MAFAPEMETMACSLQVVLLLLRTNKNLQGSAEQKDFRGGPSMSHPRHMAGLTAFTLGCKGSCLSCTSWYFHYQHSTSPSSRILSGPLHTVRNPLSLIPCWPGFAPQRKTMEKW